MYMDPIFIVESIVLGDVGPNNDVLIVGIVSIVIVTAGASLGPADDAVVLYALLPLTLLIMLLASVVDVALFPMLDVRCCASTSMLGLRMELD